ncbi:MAG: response regulator [Methanosarcinales archaeon]|nr:response regulator [Methanosarcinales archaeon]
MESIKILIVEDEIIVADDLENVLIDLGYEVVGRTGSAKNAVNMAIELKPDLILMDIILKGNTNGIDASCEIKDKLNIPIIFLTAHSDFMLIDKAKNTQADGFIIKPFQEKQLYASIEIALHKSQMEEVLEKEKIKYRDLSKQLDARVAQRTAELEASNEELEAFIYSVSHDLKAPLRHVDGFSHILLSKYSNQLPDDAKNYIDRINKSIKNMNGLINGLLILSRVGRKELNIRSVELNGIINDTIREMEFDISGHSIEWNIGKLPDVDCDPDLIKIVVDNLLMNAVKFTSECDHPVITIESLSDDRSGFKIHDNGVGFDMKDYHRLFNVFQQLHKKDELKGTGIGLATVHRIVARHNGHIWAQARINQGATFFVALPYRN